jgi:hypothetical protein
MPSRRAHVDDHHPRPVRDPGRSCPPASRLPCGCPWGVRAVGLLGNVSAYEVGNTLDQALEDLSEGVRAALGDGSLPDELTREIAVTVGDAA